MSAEAYLPDAVALQTQAAISCPGNNARRTSNWVRQATHLLVILVLAFGCYLVISHFLVGSVEVVGVSMHPTLRNTDRYLLNRWVFHFRAPRRSEIVVLRDPQDQGLSVKRVVGLPGDVITIRQGAVYVNKCLINESYLPPGTPTYGPPTFACGENQFFLLGDNRNSSLDSRVYGPVPIGNILGLLVK